MIHYIIQVLIFQSLFLLAFDWLLKRETFFNTNRIYLLITPALSLLLPYIQIDSLRTSLPQPLVVELPEVILSASTETTTTPTPGADIWFFLWLAGALVCLSFFIFKLLKIYHFKANGTLVKQGSHQWISLPKTSLAFSFFNTIYLGDNISEDHKKDILMHEEVHIRQKHSYDLLYFEIFKIFFWFNPLVYMYQIRLAVLQEYIADEQVTRLKSRKDYYQQLLSQLFQTEKISFINTFFNHSLIKKRILMLQKSKSSKMVLWKYTLLLPLVFSMLLYTSCSGEAEEKSNSLSDQIASLTAEIKSKESLSDTEKAELKRMMAEIYPETAIGGKELHFGDKGKGDNVFFQEKSVPFTAVEKVPVYPGCEGISEAEAKKCFVTSITNFVVENFNTKTGEQEMKGQQRIVTSFKITQDGTITDVAAKADYPSLVTEAERVIGMLPNMKPGEQDGKKVSVAFVLPIIFALD